MAEEACRLWGDHGAKPAPRESGRCARHSLHFAEVDFVYFVGHLVVVFVDAVEIEQDRDALARVVEVIAAIEDLLGIFRVVVLEVVGEIEIVSVDLAAECVQI